MTELQFDLDTLLDLQVLYSPLKKVLEYLLMKDKALTGSLNGLEEKVNCYENKLNEQQEGLNVMNITVSSFEDKSKVYDEKIAECSLFINSSV